MPRGVCKLAGHILTDVRTPAECAEAGGIWEEGPEGTNVIENGPCFVRNVLTRSLADTILWLGGTAQLAVDVRDQVMMPTEFGKRMVEQYYASIPRLFEIARQDHRLVAECLQAWLMAYPFVKKVVEAASDDKVQAKKVTEDLRFSGALHSQCLKVIGMFRERANDPKFLRFLDMCETELSAYKGLTGSQALESFRRLRTSQRDPK
jgi:hypothetical protein